MPLLMYDGTFSQSPIVHPQLPTIMQLRWPRIAAACSSSHTSIDFFDFLIFFFGVLATRFNVCIRRGIVTSVSV